MFVFASVVLSVANDAILGVVIVYDVKVSKKNVIHAGRNFLHKRLYMLVNRKLCSGYKLNFGKRYNTK